MLELVAWLGFVVGAVFIWLYFKSRQRIERAQQELQQLQQEIAAKEQLLLHQKENSVNVIQKLEQLTIDRQQLELEKSKIQDRNKKVWAMNETVYREKKKVDEELEKLNQEKEKLESAKNKLDEKVKKLWATSTAVHKEKERINQLKQEIEHRHQEIMDSVNYAQRIQEAILPSIPEIKKHLPDSFILYKPRDIVSGDFFWFAQKQELSIIACVDCTGHGVPGAFMSMIGNTLLNQIILERNITQPDAILNELDKEIRNALKQGEAGSDSRDGMDIAVCSLHLQNRHLQYAAANRPLYLIHNKELNETKADKFAIGGHLFDEEKKFTLHEFSLQQGDTIILSSDGFADQFSADDKKLKTKRFKEILLEINHQDMNAQQEYLDKFITNWRGNMEQTDDILVMGVRV
jgi:serine phosphatase RsbU (regulator of sigma subunit)